MDIRRPSCESRRNNPPSSGRGRDAMSRIVGRLGLIVLVAVTSLAVGATTGTEKKPAKADQSSSTSSKFVLEDVRIEGKIRRPQLVLIKADQRPAFEPMSMQSFGKNADIVGSVDQTVIENSPYKQAFKFEGRAIANCVP
jgi:hypothetical protein